MAAIDVPEISLAEQSSIVDCLDRISDKIALNREINRNLEAMARQLYDYHFTRSNTWPVLTLGELCSFKNGINYSKDEIGNKFKIINVRNISATSFLLNGETFDEISIPSSKAKKYILSDKDIIIARSGCPGTTRLYVDNPEDVLFCGFIICCTPNDSKLRYYLTYQLKNLEGTSATTSGGSILQNVSQDTLKMIKIPIPSIEKIDAFNIALQPIITKMRTVIGEILTLTNIRDELLPLLMNGQVSVRPQEVNCDLVA